MRAVDLRSYSIDVPTADEYSRLVARRSALALDAFRVRCATIACTARLVMRLVVSRPKVIWIARMLERLLAQPMSDGDRDELRGVLERLRRASTALIELREMFNRRRGVSARIVLWLLDDRLAIVDDVVETLELSVDPEVREHLAREIQQIADSHPPDTHVHTPA